MLPLPLSPTSAGPPSRRLDTLDRTSDANPKWLQREKSSRQLLLIPSPWTHRRKAHDRTLQVPLLATATCRVIARAKTWRGTLLRLRCQSESSPLILGSGPGTIDHPQPSGIRYSELYWLLQCLFCNHCATLSRACPRDRACNDDPSPFRSTDLPQSHPRSQARHGSHAASMAPIASPSTLIHATQGTATTQIAPSVSLKSMKNRPCSGFEGSFCYRLSDSLVHTVCKPLNSRARCIVQLSLIFDSLCETTTS